MSAHGDGGTRWDRPLWARGGAARTPRFPIRETHHGSRWCRSALSQIHPKDVNLGLLTVVSLSAVFVLAGIGRGIF